MKYKISKQKKIELEKELEHLETVEKERINKLMAGSKWTESTRKYAAAVIEKQMYEEKLRRVKHILKNSVVLDPKKIDKSKVGIGVKVVLSNSNRTLKWKIVSSIEADPAKNMISLESPVGKSLKGKKVGDDVILPTGEKFVIAKIV